MKPIALTSTVFALTAASLLGQSQSDIEFLRARADAHERKISQLEKELIRLKSHHADKQVDRSAVAASTSSSSPQMGDYTVKKGDILTRIAYRHKTTVAAIMQANGLSNDRIRIGQKLSLPGASKKPAALVPAPVAKKESKSTPVDRPMSSEPATKHVVKSGETFYSIARQHKVSVQSLVAANPSVRPTRLHVGQRLVVNSRADSASSSSKSQAKPNGVAKKVADSAKQRMPAARSKKVVRSAPVNRAPASHSNISTEKSLDSAIRTITVYKQMTYGQFASKHGVSTTQLNALNGLSLSKNTMLAKGSELYVPQY
ncbi:MAG: LysM peptidoglycan-binding domain-containing protein [Verrucomicrobiae bacterium]|nr:LysM peptidoglycan-binding domain-containing protein [Verrucomicrobiae bacterium]NNJ43435.1 LysM peptidoglycan-binding domain-containing protein [Akkermansiaceae bacterium]